METVMPILVGGLVAAGLYLMLRRNALAIFVGLVILSHGVNLAIFTAGGLRGEPPIRDEPHAESLVVADPLAQAMILTSIVIGLGVQSFALILVYSLVRSADTYDLDLVRETEPGQPAGAGRPGG